MDHGRVLILIPARYASSRFPGKPLALIDGVSMIERVYRNCSQTGHKSVVVTDDQRIEDHVKSFGGEVCRVDDSVSTGTERIHLAFKRFYSDFDYVVNVQGDEPLLQARELSGLIDFHGKESYDICTLIRPMWGAGFEDPNRVKAIWVPENNRCLYFSRSPIPYKRKEGDDSWNLHVGVYSYTAKALEQFCQSPRQYYEKLEELEQLRALSLGMSIGAIKTEREIIGVDTPEDITKLEGVLRGKKDD